MPLVLPLQRISSNSMMGGCHTGYHIRLGCRLEPRLLAYMLNFHSALLLAWEEGRQLAHVCSMAMGNMKVTDLNRLIQELEAVLGHS